MTAPEKLLEQGRQKAKEGKFDEAIACFEQVADADAENADARFYLAGVYYKQGKISQAKQAVKEALRCDPFHEKAAALLQKLQPDRPIQRGESQLP